MRGSEIKAVILAAGRPGDTFPDDSKQKVLYHVNGEVLLERLTRQLREAGFEDIRLVTGYGAKGIEEFNRDRKLNLQLVYNPEWDGDPVESLRVGTKDLDDDVLIVFGDILANTQVFIKFLECDAPLAWIKTIIPWGAGLSDKVFRNDRQVCIVKIAREKLTIFEEKEAEEYLTQFTERCYPSMTEQDGMRLNGLLLEGMYRNGPVEEIVVPSPIFDVDYYNRTDEGNPKLLKIKTATRETMPQWMIHLKDGTTLTDADVYPHEVDSELITSVERNVGGRTITIKGSPLIEGFFIGTEASVDFKMMGRGAGTSSPPETLKRILGCYIKDSDPPIQCQFSMDPRTHNTILEFFEVHNKAPEGIKARRLNPQKRGMIEMFQRQFVDNFHGIVKSPLIEQADSTPNGMACVLVKPKVRAEIYVHGSDVLLGFGPPGEP